MATEHATSLSGRRGRWLAGLVLAGLALAPGCVLLDKKAGGTTASVEAAKPAGPKVTRLVMAWEPKILKAPDPLRNGSMYPALGGRMYLFDEAIKDPLVCDGTLHVELYDVSPRGRAPVEPKLLETWDITADLLQRFHKKDLFGDGYTIVLPWVEYRETITKVVLKSRFTPSAGPAPLFSDPATLNLGNPLLGLMNQPGHGPIGQNIEQVKGPPRR